MEKYNQTRSPLNSWSPWINTGDPSVRPYDLETVQMARNRGFRVCR